MTLKKWILAEQFDIDFARHAANSLALLPASIIIESPAIAENSGGAEKGRLILGIR